MYFKGLNSFLEINSKLKGTSCTQTTYCIGEDFKYYFSFLNIHNISQM